MDAYSISIEGELNDTILIYVNKFYYIIQLSDYAHARVFFRTRARAEL